MKNKAKILFDISNFEPVSEDSESKLVGGFSTSLAHREDCSVETLSNNCLGGNCADGCGDGQTSNCAAGCGAK